MTSALNVVSRKTLPESECVKSVRLSPDGSTVAVVTTDPVFTVYPTDSPFGGACREIKAGGDIYDHDFYPGFSSANPLTQSVLIASRNRPVNLFNLVTGQVVSAYTAYSYTEEIVHPFSVRFSPHCTTILGGFNSSTVRVWDVQRPGRQTRDISTASGGQKGIVSAVEYCSDETFATGCYSRSICVWDLRDKSQCMRVGEEVSFGGVVQLKASGNLLLSGHRQDTSVNVWDIRSPDVPLMQLPRVTKTHQRFEFGLVDDRFVFAGDHYGDLTVFDLSKDGEIVIQESMSAGTPLVSVSAVNGTVAVGYGCRRWGPIHAEDDDSSDMDTESVEAGGVALLRIDSLS